MELQYVKEMQKRGIQIKDLPEDAQTGIKEINKALSFMKMAEAKGKNVGPDAIKKIKAMDKWVLYEIYDLDEGTEDNEEEIPFEGDDVKESIEKDDDTKHKEEVNKGDQDLKFGNSVNEELKAMYLSNKDIWSIDEIKSDAKNTYKAIFDVYQKGEENGVKTQSFSLIEFEEQKYKLTKI